MIHVLQQMDDPLRSWAQLLYKDTCATTNDIGNVDESRKREQESLVLRF